ncbi:hypothetical protein V8F20_008263 [Naviculisporaceae sp. PSN 640]
MASFADSGDSEENSFDNSRPFAGVVICCTSIPPEHRANIALKTEELGGVHKYDLTPDCTHLIVGDYDTPKYRHVVKERPDVKCMDAHWVTAVRDLWVQDADIDFAALEKEWQLKTFEIGGGEPTPDGSVPKRVRLLCCMTGFEDFDVRQDVIDKIKAHGGNYTGDLSRSVTHLIAHKPIGKKYQAAKNWGVHTVSIEWVNDSIERGLILDEKLYDPVLSPEERGVGAWNRESLKLRVRLGKRLRETSVANKEEGRRKLRKTASMKLSTQRDHLWGDILGKPKVDEPAPVAAPQPQVPAFSAKTQPTQQQTSDTQATALSSLGRQDESVIFASCCFFIHGFEKKKHDILANVISSLGGLVCHSLEEVVSTSGAQLSHRFLAVPQSSSPDTHPPLPDNVNIITEFYIEKCMHHKYFFDPRQHVIGRPFPVFPIPGFEKLSISTAGFTGVDLNQVDKAIRQLGATYQETFNAQASVLICVSLEKVRPQKLDLAVVWKVPVVSNEWLWQCISTGYNVPIEDYIFPEIKERIELQKRKDREKEKGKGNADKRSKTTQDQVDPDLVPKAHTKPKKRGFDVSGLVAAFKPSSSKTPEPSKQQATSKEKGGARSALALQEPGEDSFANAHFETALTHQVQANTESNSGNSTSSSSKNSASAPLSEASNNSLNKTPRSPKKPGKGKEAEDRSQPQQKSSRKPLSRVFSEVADSEATEGDVGSADELPPLPSDNENVRQQEEESPEEIERKRIEAEKEADRLALASRFASMIESGAAIAPGSLGEDPGLADMTAATSGRVGLTRVLSDTGMVGISIGMGSATTTVTKTTGRRKRGIFGRATSNVSNASSGSADSVAAGAVAGVGKGSSNTLAGSEGGNGNCGGGGGLKRAGSGVTRVAADNGDTAAGAKMTEDPIVTSVSDNDKDADAKSEKSSGAQQREENPSSTQLEYKDPEANWNRARLMNKMRGVAGSNSDGSISIRGGSFSEEKPEEKLTLADLGGYDVGKQKQGEYGSTASRRVTRRRG